MQQFGTSLVCLQKEQRRSRGFDPDLIGAGGVRIGVNGAVDGRNMSLKLPFAMDPHFADVLAAFNALGFVQIPHPRDPALISSPVGGAPFYGTTPADYINQAMPLPAMLEFFKNLGFVIYIDPVGHSGFGSARNGLPEDGGLDIGMHDGIGPVQTGLPTHVWADICRL